MAPTGDINSGKPTINAAATTAELSNEFEANVTGSNESGAQLSSQRMGGEVTEEDTQKASIDESDRSHTKVQEESEEYASAPGSNGIVMGKSGVEEDQKPSATEPFDANLGREVNDAEAPSAGAFATDWTKPDGNGELASASDPPLPPQLYLSEHDHSIAKREMYAAINSIVINGPPILPQINIYDHDDSLAKGNENKQLKGPIVATSNVGVAPRSDVAAAGPPSSQAPSPIPSSTSRLLRTTEQDGIVLDNTDGDPIAESNAHNSRVRRSESESSVLVATVRHLFHRRESNASTIHVPEAFLVVENEGEAGNVGGLVVAEPVIFFERKDKLFVFATFLLVLIVTVLVVDRGVSKIDHEQQPVQGVRDELHCDPCIDRTTFTIKVLLNGYDSNGIKRLETSARQSAKDMGVNLDVKYYIGESSDDQMAVDIRAAALSESGVDAMIVDIPSKAIALAVRFAAENDMPVFGVNSGFEFASGPEGLVEDGSMLFFTSLDDRLGGEMAASYFLQHFSGTHDDGTGTSSLGRTSGSEKYARALFVAPTTSTYEHRYQGYRDRLVDASNNTIEVEWIADTTHLDKLLIEKISGCMYQSVLIGEARLLPLAAVAIETSGCNQVKLGSFGINPNIGSLMANEKMDFVIDQNHLLHSSTAVQFATLYVTTGLVITPPQGGVYLSGPTFITKDNFTKEILSICNKEDTNRTIDLPPDYGCIHSNKISIGGVVHGTTGDKFWDTVFSAANQSAIDMGIDLKFDRFEPQESIKALYKRMSSKILSLCDTGVDGLFVTIPDDVIVEAVMKCQELNPNVQILSINAGYEKSKKLNLIHHIGMLEKDAGYQAGKKMVKLSTFDKAMCWNHIPGLSVLDDRCKGFEQAMGELGIEYLGQILVQESNMNGSVSAAERAVNETGDWGGYGILLTGRASIPAALELKKRHSSFVIGSFDICSSLYDSLETGDILFGVDHQPYLQGYLPISILTHAVASKQSLLDHSIKSGPRFVIAPPTDQESACEDRHFPVCPVEGKSIFVSSRSPTGTSQPTSSMQPSVFRTVKPPLSMQPSFVPSFDMRPTLEIVQIRGYVRCGLSNATVKSQEGFLVDLCRAVAAVLLGDPESFVGVPVTGSTRFEKLNERAVDLLLFGDTHTIEREVKERTTGARFTFSSPFYYDGMAYFGLKTFVRCAEENERFGDCSSLLICATEGSTGLDFVQSSFPSDFVKVGLTIQENTDMLFNNTCNVIANDRSILLNIIAPSDDRDFIVGDKLQTNEPLAIVARKHDHEFSDTINWVLHALFYGEEQGLTKNSSICQNYTTLTSPVSDLNFMNAVYCVGNYEEVLVCDNSNRGMNQINNGTGMLYVTPFGDLKNGEDDLRGVDAIAASSFLDGIRKKRSLNCGVVVPDGFVGELRKSDKLVGMNVDYCSTMAAALFDGDTQLVKLSSFSENDNNSFAALQNRTIDVLVGRRVEKKYDFVSSLSLGGFHFSSPYYLENGTSTDDISFLSVATREDDATFSSFVNCVVLATLYAQEKHITRENSEQMPLSPIFGSELNWALRDAIAYSGSYDEIYAKNFGDVAEEDRGRNILNEYDTPQIHSFPGLSP